MQHRNAQEPAWATSARGVPFECVASLQPGTSGKVDLHFSARNVALLRPGRAQAAPCVAFVASQQGVSTSCGLGEFNGLHCIYAVRTFTHSPFAIIRNPLMKTYTREAYSHTCKGYWMDSMSTLSCLGQPAPGKTWCCKGLQALTPAMKAGKA